MTREWFRKTLLVGVTDLMAQGSDRDVLELARDLERVTTILREELELRRENREAGK